MENETNPETALPLVAPETSVVPLIREAMAKGDVGILKEVLAVRREWEQDEARKAFNFAVGEFQRRAPIIPKADKGAQGAYAAMDRIWSAVGTLLTSLGLAVTWQVVELRGEAENGVCHLGGVLRHKLGHSEPLSFDLPMPGIIKTKEGRAVTNAAQAMGSAITYIKRYATCAALGIVTGDDMRDDDGEGAGKGADGALTKEQAQEVADLLDAARGVRGFDETGFWEWAQCKKVEELRQSQHADAVRGLKAKIAGKGGK